MNKKNLVTDIYNILFIDTFKGNTSLLSNDVTFSPVTFPFFTCEEGNNVLGA